jgi:REP element-mobilizing transposase RayT
MIFHVLNRANNCDDMFETPEDYLAFLRVMRDTLDKRPMRILNYCLLSNHWHLLLWPESDDGLGAFMQTITKPHAGRWRRHRQTVGEARRMPCGNHIEQLGLAPHNEHAQVLRATSLLAGAFLIVIYSALALLASCRCVCFERMRT